MVTFSANLLNIFIPRCQKRQFFICHFSAWSMLKNVFNIFLPI